MNTPEDNRRIAAGDPDERRAPADVVAHLADYDHDDVQPSFATDEAAAAYLHTVCDGDLAEAIGQLGYTEAGRLYNATRDRAGRPTITCTCVEVMANGLQRAE